MIAKNLSMVTKIYRVSVQHQSRLNIADTDLHTFEEHFTNWEKAFAETMSLLDKFSTAYHGPIQIHENRSEAETVFTYTAEEEIEYSIKKQVVVTIKQLLLDTPDSFDGIRI
ncbi:hypothetical protein LCGC14_0175070 [marine sediment metagenome]|uniref:Uncharacterized protein n=1 Tax=marine sediment metagenome TaxID=412755 RepID=A0A0F9XTM3_9ZZZZ